MSKMGKKTKSAVVKQSKPATRVRRTQGQVDESRMLKAWSWDWDKEPPTIRSLYAGKKIHKDKGVVVMWAREYSALRRRVRELERIIRKYQHDNLHLSPAKKGRRR